MDPDGKLLRWSRALEQELGLTDSASLVELIHADERDALATWMAARGDAGDLQLDCRVRVKLGLYRHFTLSLRRAAGATEACGSLRPRVAIDAGVAYSHKIFRGILDNLPFIVGVIDKSGVIRLGEGKGHESLGVKEGQFVGMNVFELYANEPPVLAAMKRALEGESYHFMNQLNGMHFSNWFLPVRDEKGEVESLITVSLDISESKRVEQELLAQIELIEGQKMVIRSLATPIIQVWDGVLTMPLVGVVDSMRASDVMSSLLAEVVRTRARYALLDVTGVEVMDTATAGHILRLIQAIRLLGAEGIVTGVRPVIAQTMVSIGVDMASIVTLRSLREGLQYCIQGMARGSAQKRARENE